MAINWITPVDVSVGGGAAWTDVDVTAHVPASATGVILHVHNTITGNKSIGLRKNGSTDNRTGLVRRSSHQWASIGIDANDIFEVYEQGANNLNIWLVGYYEDDAVFKTNAVQKTISTGSWLDVDISGDTGGDTAIAALFEIDLSGNEAFGARKNGSADARTTQTRHLWGIIGVDGAEIFEANVPTANIVYLVGYITKDVTLNTNALDRSLGSTGSWINLTALPAGATGGFYEVITTATSHDWGLRTDGSAENLLLEGTHWHSWGQIEAVSQIVEGRINSTNIDFFEIGYSEAAPAGWTGKIIGVTNPAKINGIAVANIAKINNVA